MNHYSIMEKYNWEEYENPSIQSINRLTPRTYFRQFNTLKEALNFDIKSRGEIIDLNGKWDFKLFNSPKEITSNVAKLVDSSFKKIDVPLPWQMAGYGKMHYSDVWWIFPIIPPKVISANPTGVYHRTFNLTSVSDKKDYILRFHNADSCIKIFVNNQEVGLTKGARYTSEFNITKYVKKGTNSIIVFCYQWSDGSYLEDQDQWWFSGLYRNVDLLIEDKEFIEDFYLTTKNIKEQDYEFNLSVKPKPNTNIKLNIAIYDVNKKVIYNKTHDFNKAIKINEVFNDVKEWNSETPNLYTIVFSNEKGTWFVPYKFGFREIKTNKRVLLLNNKPIMFKGVNMHSHNPKTGKYMTFENVKDNLLMMKQYNINAVRTAHYPQVVEFYDLCDELGLYVIDEADLEAHGFELTGDWSWTSNDKKFTKAYTERATRVVQRDKNHPCVLMWSLGNETGYGDNFVKMKEAILAIDKTRLIHYEGDFDCEIVDVHSNMYTRLEIGQHDPKRRTLEACVTGVLWDGSKKPNWLKMPHIECEFAHAMGNGPGSLQDYFDIFYSDECFAGGFVWEWFDHGIYCKDEKGKEYYKYGGDFGDDPTNGTFCIDGLRMPDGTASPGLIEYKEVIAPIKLELNKNEDKIKIWNHLDFTSLGQYDATLTIIDSNGNEIYCEKLDLSKIPNRAAKEFKLPDFNKEVNTYYFATVTLRTTSNTEYAKKGHIVAQKQVELSPIEKAIKPGAETKSGTIKVIENEFDIVIKTKSLDIVFDKVNANIKTISKKGQVIVEGGPKLNFWRALTDNDADQYRQIWMKQFFVHLFSETVLDWKMKKNDNNVQFKVKTVNGAINQAWYFMSEYTYTIYADDTIDFNVSGTPDGLLHVTKEMCTRAGQGSSTVVDPDDIVPKMMPRIGVKMKVNKNFKNIEYFGRGPGESYVDSKEANIYNKWTQTVDQAFTNYVHPQENGNKHKSLWLKLTDKQNELSIASVNKDERFDFSASWYDDMHLTVCKHRNDLKKENYITLNIDYKQNGLGSNSCGPMPMDKYKCRVEPFNLHFILKI